MNITSEIHGVYFTSYESVYSLMRELEEIMNMWSSRRVFVKKFPLIHELYHSLNDIVNDYKEEL